jgi:hypothetical protein
LHPCFDTQTANLGVEFGDVERVILLRLNGVSIKDVAARMNTSTRTVSIWSSRFEQSGLAGLTDNVGRGRRPSLPENKVARVISEATRPPKGRRRWSVRSMARHAGMSHSTVQRIWVKNDLKPHITRTFKLSSDQPDRGQPHPRRVAALSQAD